MGSVIGEVGAPDQYNDPVKCTRKFDVYGTVRSETGSSDSDHKFVGKLGHASENETGLIYMRARYMDPVVGRFVSEDPAKQGFNWYAYCANNPVNSVDEDGRMAGLLVGSAEEMALQAKRAAVTQRVGAKAVETVARAMLQHGAKIYAALRTGGDVTVRATDKGVSLLNSAGNNIFIHLVKFDNVRGTGNYFHFDVGGDATWKAIMKAFDRMPL